MSQQHWGAQPQQPQGGQGGYGAPATNNSDPWATPAPQAQAGNQGGSDWGSAPNYDEPPF